MMGEKIDEDDNANYDGEEGEDENNDDFKDDEKDGKKKRKKTKMGFN